MCASRWETPRGPMLPLTAPLGRSRPEMPGYKRVLLKLSGEVLAGGAAFGIDANRVAALAREVADVSAAGVQIGVVVGGGNIFRGVAAAARSMDRVTAD